MTGREPRRHRPCAQIDPMSRLVQRASTSSASPADGRMEICVKGNIDSARLIELATELKRQEAGRRIVHPWAFKHAACCVYEELPARKGARRYASNSQNQI
jgi:hypothetical protein